MTITKTGLIENTVTDRASRYGTFAEGAAITQSLKRVMHNARGWSRLRDDQCEALEMIAHKIARIISEGSDPDYIDSWADIAGYSTLIVHRLEK